MSIMSWLVRLLLVKFNVLYFFYRGFTQYLREWLLKQDFVDVQQLCWVAAECHHCCQPCNFVFCGGHDHQPIVHLCVPTVRTFVCMYVCMVIYVRATAYSLDCHVGTMINRRLNRTFQSLVVHRTAAVTSTGRELSVAMSSIELGQSMRSFAVHSS